MKIECIYILYNKRLNVCMPQCLLTEFEIQNMSDYFCRISNDTSSYNTVHTTLYNKTSILMHVTILCNKIHNYKYQAPVK